MPNIDRREFLKLVGAGGVGAGAGFMLRESKKDPTEYLIPYVVDYYQIISTVMKSERSKINYSRDLL